MITANEELLSPEQAGERLGVSVYTVRRWIKEGRLRAFKPGKEYRIQATDLEEFLRAREVRPKAPRRSPYEPSLLNGLEEERRSSRFAEAIATAAAERWAEDVLNEGVDDSKRSELIKVAIELGDLIRDSVEEDDWEAIPIQERREIVTTMRSLNDVVSRGIRSQHAKFRETAEVRIQEEKARQNQEKIREWNQRTA